MLTLILEIIGFVKQTTYLGLMISYKTGQLIIYSLHTLIAVLLQITANLEVVLRVLYEDFYVFLCDVGQRLLHIINVTSDVVQSVVNCVVIVCESVKFGLLGLVLTVMGAYNAILSGIGKILEGVTQAFVFLKYFILLLGSGIWFAVTVIPLFILYTCTMFTYYLGRFIGEIVTITSSSVAHCKQSIRNFYEFLTDVPLESIAGLIAGACIVYVIIKFQILLYQKILSSVELFRQYVQWIRLRLTRVTIRRQSVQDSSSGEQTDSSEENMQDLSENRLCLICQDRVKCILMLPCRHICICNVCNIRLQNYNRTCPICRSLVDNTMKVFV